MTLISFLFSKGIAIENRTSETNVLMLGVATLDSPYDNIYVDQNALGTVSVIGAINQSRSK